ncbi:hypothetical protein ACLOJK_028494 [Asimina triloba]
MEIYLFGVTGEDERDDDERRDLSSESLEKMNAVVCLLRLVEKTSAKISLRSRWRRRDFQNGKEGEGNSGIRREESRQRRWAFYFQMGLEGEGDSRNPITSSVRFSQALTDGLFTCTVLIGALTDGTIASVSFQKM